MADPEKIRVIGNDWHQAVLPNPFYISDQLETGLAVPVSAQKIDQDLGLTERQPSESQERGLMKSSQGFLDHLLPNFAGEIPLLDGYDEPQIPSNPQPALPNYDPTVAPARASTDLSKLRGIGLIGAVFNVLSKELGGEFSTAELMLAAQQLIDVSKAEYVGIPYKTVAERAGYYSWDLVRAFSNHAWQITRVETKLMDHCDSDEFAPESFETAKLLIQGWGERTWEF